MARKATRAVRLPAGRYAYRGRAVPFSKLPKREQARFRASWARKAVKTRTVERKRAAAPKERRSAREWVERRTEWVPAHGRPEQYAVMVEPAEILGRYSPKAILAMRVLQREAHAAYMDQGKHGGALALEVASQITDKLGADLAAMMPQLWWYH